MDALTTDTANQLCKDLEDLTAIMELLAASKALTPNVLATLDECANSCEKFIVAYTFHKR